MSDPVTNVEIEDVLTSIRRLVSNEERPKPGSATPAAPARAGGPDRLVLTPSLRVDAADAVPAQRLPEFRHGASRVDTPKKDEASAGAGVLPAGDRAGTRAAPDDNAGLRARVAELEEVVARQGDAWDPDGVLGDENSGGPVGPLPWEDTEEDSADASGPAAPEEAGDAPDDAQADELSDDPAAHEAADAPAAPAGSDRDGPAVGEDILDEDALRDLVAEVVRQELQGALGERITRNVRKLVRREIQRALAAQDVQ